MNKPCIDRIIFLDFDGVLNSDKVHDPLPQDKLNLIKEDMAREPTLASLARQLDPSLIERLRTLVFHLEAGIVFSSSWRLLLSLEDMALYFSKCCDFSTDCFWGSTPNCGLDNRGTEIESWMNNNQFEGEYLILDDMPIDDFLASQRSRLLQTDHRIGLSHDDIDQALAMFGLSSQG